MSLRAIVDIIIHLDSFRNIDLFFQGLYYLKVKLYNKKNGEVSNEDIIILSYSMRILIACSHHDCQKKNKEK